MPYEIRKVQKGWKVFTKGTDRSHSNDPLPLARAKEQLKALYANADPADEKKGGSTLLARVLFPTASAIYDTVLGKNIFTGQGRGMIGGFDDSDWTVLYGGVEDDDAIDQGSKEDAEALVKQAEDKFDVEEATGEPEYLKQAKAYAKKAGYKDASSLKLADDGKHKLELRGVKFGSITNNDFIIYKQHFPALAEKKRKQYLARAKKIKGDWAKNKYSPNSLAINILWDGARKSGGADEDEEERELRRNMERAKLESYNGDYQRILDQKKRDLMLQNADLYRQAQEARPEGVSLFTRDQMRTLADETDREFRASLSPADYAEYLALKKKYPNWKGGFDWGRVPGISEAIQHPFLNDAVQEGTKFISDTVSDFFKTPEEKEKERKRKEACEICNKGAGYRGGEKKMNFRKEGDDPRNWGYDEEEEIEAPPPEQPQFIGDPTQFKPLPYDPNNPLMYMVGGAVPINKKLYEKAKEIVYPRYKKPSAYRSGAVVKLYKEMGGKFKENNGRPLARWFREEWQDVGNKEYPVYRPTKRVSKDTPLTASEIDPENLRLQIREKQEIRGEKNLKPFVKKGGRLAQTDEEETKIAKKIIQKVAGEQNAEVKKISETPMGDDNIRKYLPNSKILKYSELADVSNIEELLPSPKSYFFLLYERSINNGHWVVVNRYIDNGRDTICYFCSYGSKIDEPLRWNSPEQNRELGQDKPYLSILLRNSGKKLQYNNVQYQSKTSPVATCGAFATLWIKANLRDNMTLQDFHEWIAEIKKETGLSYDAIASNAISQR